MRTYWISFGDVQCAGVAFVDAESPEAAMEKCSSLRIVPRTYVEAEILDVTNDQEALATVVKLGRNRLISAKEMMRPENRAEIIKKRVEV